jgi:hypothetical protein
MSRRGRVAPHPSRDGFFKREDQIDALERTVAWFEKYLKP